MLDSTLVAFMGMFLSYAHAISVFDRLESTGTSATTQSKKCHQKWQRWRHKHAEFRRRKWHRRGILDYFMLA